MVIEIHSPQGKVKEWIIDFVKSKLVEFHHADKEISRAEVYFKEQTAEEGGNKICEINLTIFGDSLFVHRNAETFEEASREAVATLTSEIEQRVKQQNEVPDSVTSTVKV